MQVVSSITQIQEYLQSKRGLNRIVLVPTMGALHEGHISLIKKAHNIGDLVVVSIFLNPLQFAVGEDLNKYPKSLKTDLIACESNLVDMVFTPEIQEMYPNTETCTITPPPSLCNCLCGIQRPGHFTGVLTVVLKLLNIIQPQIAVFGEKDYQQLCLIRHMCKSLNLNIDIIGQPIIRETSGLALSSRNQYLSDSELSQAANLYKALFEVKTKLLEGLPLSESIQSTTKQYLLGDLEYLELRCSHSLQLLENVQDPCRLFIASRINNTRLIDNISIT